MTCPYFVLVRLSYIAEVFPLTFEELFPESPVNHQPKDFSVFRSKESSPCFVCGEPTHWVDLCYEAPLCSTACDYIIGEIIFAKEKYGEVYLPSHRRK